MKMVAGMGQVDEYIPYSEAGADEVFIGYVPDFWNKKYGMNRPLNRREVMYCNVQVGSKSELIILENMARIYKVRVVVALNALHFEPEQYEDVLKVIDDCKSVGIDSFIIADYDFMAFINEKGVKDIRIHVSGELGQMNHLVVKRLYKLGANRIIFHRKVTPEDMKLITDWCRNEGMKLEFEAFALNEKCHFTGAYCNSLHCDELAHICHLPYRFENGADETEATGTACNQVEIDESIPGGSGCGLCALWKLRDAGITHLKLVSRGNYMENTIEDIALLKKALEILEDSSGEEEYKKIIKSNLFDEKCSGNCYYFY